MDLLDLVRSLRSGDALEARAWVAEATTSGLLWERVPRPRGLDGVGMAIAAGIAELLAERTGQAPPGWTHSVPPSPQPVFLVRAAAHFPRLRRSCEEEGPEPLRRRKVYAPPEFLTVA